MLINVRNDRVFQQYLDAQELKLSASSAHVVRGGFSSSSEPRRTAGRDALRLDRVGQACPMRWMIERFMARVAPLASSRATFLLCSGSFASVVR